MVLPRSIWRTMVLKFSNPRGFWSGEPGIGIFRPVSRCFNALCLRPFLGRNIHSPPDTSWCTKYWKSLFLLYLIFTPIKIGLPPTSGSNTRIRLKKRNRVTSKKNPTAVQDVRNSGICSYKPDWSKKERISVLFKLRWEYPLTWPVISCFSVLLWFTKLH